MAQKKTVLISDSYDGFHIIINQDEDNEEVFHIDQEDTRERLVDVFASLGIEADYETT
jgi:type IV secretory pathway VirD2 relaxase